MQHASHVRIHRRPFEDALDVLIYEIGTDGQRYVARQMEFVVVGPGELTQPTVVMPASVAQEIMDELFRAGLRPADFQDTTGEVNALKAHLADMQQLVFNPRGVHNAVLKPRERDNGQREASS